MFVCSLHSHWNSFTLHLLYTAFFPILFPTIYIIENVSCIPRYEIMHFILFAAFFFIDMGLQKKARNDAAGQLSALLYKHSALLRYLMQQWQSFYSKFFFLKVGGAHLPIASFNWGSLFQLCKKTILQKIFKELTSEQFYYELSLNFTSMPFNNT